MVVCLFQFDREHQELTHDGTVVINDLDPLFEKPGRLPVFGIKAPVMQVDKLDRFLKGVEVNVQFRWIFILEVQVVAGSAALVILVGGLDHLSG